jgi:RHS repeat-associated protein
VLAEHNGSTGAVLIDYVYSGSRMIAKIASGSAQYFLSDRLSTRLALDSNGNVSGRQGHLPFGELFGESGTQEKHHFTSYERDGESGVDYAINRGYSANVGRFRSADPYRASAYMVDPQSWNRYGYTRNNPVDRIDLLGLEDDDVIRLYGWGWGDPLGGNGISRYPTAHPRTYEPDPIPKGPIQRIGIKAPLTGKKLKKYNDERAKTQDKLKNSQKCRDFLSSHGIDPDQALDAVNQQRAFDGTKSTIGAFDAGVYNSNDIDWSNPQAAAAANAPIRNLFNDPTRDVGAITASYPGGLPPSQTTVADRSDVYYSGGGISASNILHEALHSLTGASDSDLAQQLGVTLGPGGSSQPISDALHNNDCGG